MYRSFIMEKENEKIKVIVTYFLFNFGIHIILKIKISFYEIRLYVRPGKPFKES